MGFHESLRDRQSQADSAAIAAIALPEPVEKAADVARRDPAPGIGHLEEHRIAWGMLYSLASLTPTSDISDAINTQVAAAHGDAVIHLSIRSKPCAANFVPLVNWLPFWPGCSKLVFEGDIIRVLPAVAAKAGAR